MEKRLMFPDVGSRHKARKDMYLGGARGQDVYQGTISSPTRNNQNRVCRGPLQWQFPNNREINREFFLPRAKTRMDCAFLKSPCTRTGN